MKKMKTFRNCAMALVMALVLVLSPMRVFAAEELPTEAHYDLEIGGTQTFVIQDENGEIATVTVSEVAGDSRIATGTYRVEYEVPLAWVAGFYVSISNNQIYNAYGAYYTCFRGEIRYPSLIRPSNITASYVFIYENINIPVSTGFDATISGSVLKLTRR
ncbi:MAG: hypothetical protein E7253_08820 [Lachnospiraceae bacterium]|nr:hypothetical protein [Lachnospiraceae bacterium]